ncbi:MAG: methylenetetrahydrofolate reductase [Methanocellales archaeon]|nr:methylenetetrahydrofolate reductase [Methanocellales archaeon]
MPDHIITRLEGAKKPAEEGVQIAIELCQELKNIKKISGIHIMTIAWEESVPLIIQGANLR